MFVLKKSNQKRTLRLIGNSARPGESYGVEEACHLKCNRGIQSRRFSCDSYEGQQWTKITASPSPSRCGQMRLHWPASRRIPHASGCISIDRNLFGREDPVGFARI